MNVFWVWTIVRSCKFIRGIDEAMKVRFFTGQRGDDELDGAPLSEACDTEMLRLYRPNPSDPLSWRSLVGRQGWYLYVKKSCNYKVQFRWAPLHASVVYARQAPTGYCVFYQRVHESGAFSIMTIPTLPFRLSSWMYVCSKQSDINR